MIVNNKRFTPVFGAIMFGAVFAFAPVNAAAQTSVCAKVSLAISQEATLEREAFDAALGITNEFPNYGLENFRVDVVIKDAAGNPADGMFFVKVNSKDGITGVDGTGIVQPATTADVHWLIIPSTGAGGTDPLGLKYSVKADISYKLNGIYQTVSTYEDHITVKPQPALKLEYMLPFEVFADEPLTEGVIEPVEPFPAGVRVTNVGYGTAKNFKIDSGQPEITDNKQGFAVDTKLLGTYVGNKKIPDTLLVPFGDVAAGGVTQAAWIMSTNLSGRFIKFDAKFSHADELGGQLTSLVQNATTYTLLKDVLVDLPGRDSQFDFLVNTTASRDTMYDILSASGEIAPDFILESDQPAPIPVERLSSDFSGALGGANTSATLKLTGTSVSNAWVYTSIPAPLDGKARLLSAVRSDGKAINSKNIWISTHFNKNPVSYIYRLNLLDYNPPPMAEYTLNFALNSVDAPPAAISDLSAFSVYNSTQEALSWSSTGEDGSNGSIFGGHYLIESATSAAAAFSPSSAQIVFSTNTMPGIPQNYPLAGLMGNTSNYFKLWLQDTGGSISADSNLAQLYVLPNPPVDLVTGIVSSATVAVTWSAGNNNAPIEYSVSIDTDAAEPVMLASPFKEPSDRSFLFAGLTPNTTYLIYGQGKNPESGVMSAQAALGGVVTLAAGPGALSASTIYISSFTLTWGANGNPDWTEYLVQISTLPKRTSAAKESGWVRSDGYAFSGLLEGTSYYARVKARNSAGIETAFTNLGIFKTGRLDIIAPVTDLAFAGTHFGSEPVYVSSLTKITLSAFDDVTNVGDRLGTAANSYYSVDSDTYSIYAGTITIPGEGAHLLRYYSVDAAGNMEAVKTSSITVDNTAPVTAAIVHGLELADGATAYMTAGDTVTLRATDEGSGPAGVYYTFDMAFSVATSTAYITPFTLEAGTHTVHYTAFDNLGSQTPIKSVFVTVTGGKIFYVAGNTGNDSNNGLSLARAFATIMHAVSAAGPGDTVLVATGTYHESLNIIKSSVTLRAIGEALLDGDTNGDGVRDLFSAFRVDSASDVKIIGFTVRNYTAGISAVWADGILISSCVSTDNLADDIDVGHSSGAMVEWNTALRSGFGIAVQVGTVRYNVVAHNRDGIMAGENQPTEAGTFVYNNTAYDNTVEPGRGSGIVIDARYGHISVRNNILAKNLKGYSVMDSSGMPSNVDMDYSDIWGNLWNDPLMPHGAHDIFGDPRFVNEAGDDYRLEANSPSIGAGENGVTIGYYQGPFLPATDRQPPVVSAWINGRLLTDGATVYVTAADTFTLTAVDDLSGPKDILYTFNTAFSTASATVYTPPLALSSGTYAMYYSAVDNAGHVAAAKTAFITMHYGAPDITPPATQISIDGVMISSNAPAIYVRPGSAVTFGASDPLVDGYASGVALTTFTMTQLISSNWVTLISGTYSFPLIPQREGYYTLYFQSVDRAGNWEAQNVRPGYVDGTAPLINVLINGTTIESGASVTMASTDTVTLSYFDPVSNGIASGIKSPLYSLDTEFSTTTAIPYSEPFMLAAGTHTVFYTAVDNAGNIAEVKITSITVSAANYPAEISPSSGPIGVPFTITGTGFGAYSAGITVALIGGTTAPLTLWSTTTIKGTVPGGLAPGEYPVLVKRGTTTIVNVEPFTVTVPVLDTITPSSGAIGIPFTLTGAWFGNYAANYTKVLIGGATAPLTLWTDTKIQGTVPGALGIGDHDVIIERAINGGVVRSSSVTFTLVTPSVDGVTPSSGAIGVPFTITGTNFGNYVANYTKVLIGGATAPLTLWTDTKIQGTISGTLNPGDYNIVVERALNGGVVDAEPAQFKVITPSLFSIIPTSGSIGVSFTLTGANFGNYVANYTRVLIGGATAPLTLWSDSKIQGTVPGLLASGTYDVAVERALNGGLVRTSTVPFTLVIPSIASVTPPSGAIGVPFTITGTNFGNYVANYTVVLIGGATAPLTLWSDTKIQGTIPGVAPGDYDLVVQRELNGGVVTTPPAQLKVIVPTLTGITPSTVTIGSPFTLTGSNFGNYISGYTNVLIGGATAPLTLWNDTTIQGTIPGSFGSGQYPVTVERRTADGIVARSNALTFAAVGINVSSITPVAGPIGVPFTLYGSNFGNYVANYTMVLIGGASAPLTLWTDTKIQGTIPGGLMIGDYPVVVERNMNGGQVLSSTLTWTMATPSLASVNPSSGAIGIPFTLTGANFGNYVANYTKVLIGGATAPLTLWTDTQIQGTIPGALTPGDYALYLERALNGGVVRTSTATFTVAAPGITSVSPSTIAVIAPFTLTGYGFGNYVANYTKVVLNGLAAPLTLWSETKIQGKLPFLPAGNYPLQVQRYLNGGLAESATAYISVAGPLISSMTPSSGSGGTAFTINGSYFGPYDSSLVNGKPSIRVTVDGAVCSLSLWSDTQIKGLIPDSISFGTHTVLVERAASGGTASSNAVLFTKPGGGYGVSSVSSFAKTKVAPVAVGEHKAGLPLSPDWGGAVESPARSAVIVPENALAEETVITISPDNPSSEEAARRDASGKRELLAAVGPAVAFGPEGLIFGHDAELKLPYDIDKLPSGKTVSDLAVYWWDDKNSEWVMLPSEPEQTPVRLKAKTGHFSVYQVMASGVAILLADPAFKAGEHYAYPNPTKGNNPKFHFECGLADSARLSVYDISGHKVYEADMGAAVVLGSKYAYEKTWDVGNAASGVYVYILRANKIGFSDIVKKGKVAVIR